MTYINDKTYWTIADEVYNEIYPQTGIKTKIFQDGP